MTNKVVIAESTVSAGQLKDLFRMIYDGTIGGDEMTEFLANPRKFSFGKTTIVRATSILGLDRVFTADKVALEWDLETPKHAIIRYCEETLRQCAKENQQGTSDWRLVYINGLSLREQYEKRRKSARKQPHFDPNHWWHDANDDDWATYKPQTGYYLINCQGQFGHLAWQEQREAIAKNAWVCCHEALFCEAIMTIYMVNNGEQISEDWYHRGGSTESDGTGIEIGDFRGGRVRIYGGAVGASANSLMRVVCYRKFDS